MMAGWARGLACLAVGLGVAAGPAQSASLDIKGSYGNESGCRFLETNDYGDDSVVTLTADAYETAVTSCEFLQVLTARSGARVATMLCGHEGEEAQTVEFLRIVKDQSGADAFDLFAETGDPRGRVEPCAK